MFFDLLLLALFQRFHVMFHSTQLFTNTTYTDILHYIHRAFLYNWLTHTNKCTKTSLSLISLLKDYPNTHFGTSILPWWWQYRSTKMRIGVSVTNLFWCICWCELIKYTDIFHKAEACMVFQIKTTLLETTMEVQSRMQHKGDGCWLE